MMFGLFWCQPALDVVFGRKKKRELTAGGFEFFKRCRFAMIRKEIEKKFKSEAS